MSFDPFAPDADEAQTEVTAAVPAQETLVQASSRPVAAPSNEGKVVVTLKGGTGYDAPWIVIHANDASDAVAQMDGKLAELATHTAKVAKFFQGQVGPAASGGAQRQQPGKPAGATQAPGGQSKSCTHGEMTFRSGMGQKGPWKGFFCPTPKDTPGQCKPEFIR